MIYTVKGFRQKQYNNPNGDDWTHLINATANPALYYGDNFKTYKATQAPYAVYGQNKDNNLDRGKSELLTRSILFIDVDNGGKTYAETKEQMQNVLDRFHISHVIYPTISHGYKSGERLRLALPLDKPINQENYIKLWLVFVVGFQIFADLTGVTKSFKQLQGLYVKTSKNQHIAPIIANHEPLKTAKFLAAYDDEPDKYRRYAKQSAVSTPKRPQRPPEHGNIPSWAISNRLRFNALTDPEGYYMEFGGWDNMLTHLGGWVYNQTHGDLTTTANIIEHVNNLGSDPIPENMLIEKCKNWAKKWSC